MMARRRRSAGKLRAKRVARSRTAHARAVEATLADIAHEIRTPLTGILALGELLATSELGARERDWAIAIKSTAEHLALVTSLIVDAVRSEAKGLVLRRELIRPRRLADALAASLAARAEAKGLEYGADISPALPEAVIGDALRRAQAQGIANHRFRQRGGNIGPVLEPLRLSAGGERSRKRIGEAARPDQLAPKHQALGLGAHRIDDERCDQGEMLGRALDRDRPIALTRAKLRRGEQLAQCQDTGQRRSDFVGDIRQRRLDRARIRCPRARHALGPKLAGRSPPSCHHTPKGTLPRRHVAGHGLTPGQPCGGYRPRSRHPRAAPVTQWRESTSTAFCRRRRESGDGDGRSVPAEQTTPAAGGARWSR